VAQFPVHLWHIVIGYKTLNVAMDPCWILQPILGRKLEGLYDYYGLNIIFSKKIHSNYVLRNKNLKKYEHLSNSIVGHGKILPVKKPATQIRVFA